MGKKHIFWQDSRDAETAATALIPWRDSAELLHQIQTYTHKTEGVSNTSRFLSFHRFNNISRSLDSLAVTCKPFLFERLELKILYRF